MKKYEHMDIAFRADLKTRAKFVLQCLAMHSNKEGQCFPGIKTIAEECGYSINTVKRALKDLEEAGFIKKEARFDITKKNGAQTSNLYTLIQVEVPPKKPCYVPKDAIAVEKQEKETEEVNEDTKQDAVEDTSKNVVKANVDMEVFIDIVKDKDDLGGGTDISVLNKDEKTNKVSSRKTDFLCCFEWAPPGIRSEPP